MVQKKSYSEKSHTNVENAFNQINLQRAESLENLRSFQNINDQLIQGERIRLEQKYGPDHPRVQKISRRIAYNQELLTALDIEIEKDKIEVPEVDTVSWMVHGRVLNEKYMGIWSLTVALYDEKGKWIRKLNYSCTDRNGYFSIIYPKKGEASEIPADQKLFLAVNEKDSKIIHRDAEPLYVKPGMVDYREMILSGGNETCSPPEPEPTTNPGPDPGTKPAVEVPKLPPDAWVIRGNVTGLTAKETKGLTISLYDKDLFFDDVLGTATTDEHGNFEIIYRSEAFRSLFDKKPDIYLKVLNTRGTVLFTSKKKVRPEAGKDEYFSIKI